MQKENVIGMVSGFIEWPIAYRHFRSELKEQGYELVDLVRGPSKELPTEQIIESMERINPCCVIGHSLGTIKLLRAACERPDLFRTIILFNPAGMAEPTTRMKGFLRILRDALNRCVSPYRGTLIRIINAVIPGAVMYFLRNPLACTKESKVAISTSLADECKSLTELGISIIPLIGENDGLFTREELEPFAREQGLRYGILKDCTHVAYVEAPMECALLVRELLERDGNAQEPYSPALKLFLVGGDMQQ